MRRATFVRLLPLTLAFAVVAAGASSAPAREAADACGVPDSAPVWLDYGEGPVKPDTRAVLARPGVVVATSGTAVPAYFRKRGAATAYFVLHLPKLVGQPADPASIPAAADALYARAAASTACTTPWIGLNELFGSALPTPWSPTNAQYRANVLALMQGLAAHGAHPVLFVNGNPSLAGDAALWWQQVAQAGSIAYEAYYDARRISALGSLLGNRRVRLGMRRTVASFVAAGVPPERLGLVLGFQSGAIAGAGGRQGLQPREAWLRVVKWETLAARQVALETHIGSVWSWGWGTFGPASVDPDKPAAACIALWARDQTLCDGQAAGGLAFNASLVEGQLVLPPGVVCGLSGGRRVLDADVVRLAALTGDRGAALDALFARTVLRSAAPVTWSQVLAVEQQTISRDFGGSQDAYLAALGAAHTTLGVARAVIRDELRRRALAAMLARAGSLQLPLQWVADRTTAAAAIALCAGDELPGSGDFPRSDTRDVPVVALPALLPFLFDDVTPPTVPSTPVPTSGTTSVALVWSYGAEPDLAGYEVLRSPAPGGPYEKLTAVLLDRPTFTDRTSAPGVPSYYVVRAVDTSGNESDPSPEVSATPG